MHEKLLYNHAYHLKSLYTDINQAPQGSYLASCGNSDICGGYLAVSTYKKENSYFSKNPKYGQWIIKIGRAHV